MKTYFKDFSIQHVHARPDLEEVISNRQYRFGRTTEYKEHCGKIKALFAKLEEVSPETKKIARDLDDEISALTCTCYSAAYRDGMDDLMAAMTFNKLSITNAEYIDFSSPKQPASL